MPNSQLQPFYDAIRASQKNIVLAKRETSKQKNIDNSATCLKLLAQDLANQGWTVGVLKKSFPHTRSTADGISADTLILNWGNGTHYEFDVIKDADGAGGDPSWIVPNSANSLRWPVSDVIWFPPITQSPRPPSNPDPVRPVLNLAEFKAVMKEIVEDIMEPHMAIFGTMLSAVEGSVSEINSRLALLESQSYQMKLPFFGTVDIIPKGKSNG